jgi:hypothetical protein
VGPGLTIIGSSNLNVMLKMEFRKIEVAYVFLKKHQGLLDWLFIIRKKL